MVSAKRKARRPPSSPNNKHKVAKLSSVFDPTDSDDTLTDLSDNENNQDNNQDDSDDSQDQGEEEEDGGEEDDDDDDDDHNSNNDDESDADYGVTKNTKKGSANKPKTPRASKTTAPTPKKAPRPSSGVARGTAAKQRTKATTIRTPSKRPAKAPTRIKSRSASSKDELPINDDNQLFNAVKDPNTALQSTAEDWVVAFQENPKYALSQLINFTIRACGCNGSVDENQVVDIDNIVDNLEELQEAFKKQPIPSYPLVSKSKSFKSFPKSLNEFLDRLILSAYEAEILTAQGFMEAFQAWVSAMSSSSLRSFRHTATVVALWTVSAINQVNAQTSKDLSTAIKQRDAEKKKARGDKSRLKELELKVIDARALKNKLQEYVDEFINSVFVHRYRDYDAGIRTECVDELGSWMKKHPQQYLQGSYFRYIGWVLSDADASVRMAAIRAMTSLYTRDNFVSSIRHFTEMFKARLVQMATADVDISVRIATISVLVMIDKHELLEEEQRDTLATHIFDVEPKVRNAVASFVANLLEARVKQHTDELGAASTASKKKGKQADEHQTELAKLRLKTLASLLVKYAHRLDKMETQTAAADEEQDSLFLVTNKQNPDLGSLIDGAREGRIGMAVEALWDAVQEIQDWKPLIELLLLDHSDKDLATHSSSQEDDEAATANNGSTSDNLAKQAYRLETDEEGVLVEALVAILRKVYQAASLAKDDQDTPKEDLTRALIAALPKLLAKYRTDAPRISDLLLIPQAMDLEMYTEMHETQAYEALWDNISDQMQRHIEPLLLKHAVEAIRKMLATTSMSNVNVTKLSALQELLVGSLRETASDRDAETAGFSEDEVHVLGANMLRLNVISQICDTSDTMEDDEGGQATSGWEIVLGLASRGRLGYREEEKMVEDAIQVLSQHVMWKTRQSLSPEYAAQNATLEAIVSKRNTLLELLNEYIASSHSNACTGVQRVAFERLVTVHMIYVALPTSTDEEKSGQEASVEDVQARSNTRLPQSLRLRCEEDVQYRCANFVQAEIERYIEKMKIRETESSTTETHNEDEPIEEGGGGDSDGNEDQGEDDDNDHGDSDRTPRASKVRGGATTKSVSSRPKTNKKGSKPTDDAIQAERPAHSQLEAEYVFCSTISTFVAAIRVGVIDARHSAPVLVHYGRLGGIYDSCCKALIEVLKEEAIFSSYNRAVIIENCIWDLLKESFELYLDNGDIASEGRFVSLSRQVANALVVRGAGFTAIKKIDSRCLISLHGRASEHVAQKVAAADRSGNKKLRTKMPMLYKGMANLLMTATPADAVKIKTSMDRAYRAAGVEIPSTAKSWEPQRSYERRLLKIAAKSTMFTRNDGDKNGQAETGRASSVEHELDSGGELSEEEKEGQEKSRLPQQEEEHTSLKETTSLPHVSGNKRTREMTDEAEDRDQDHHDDHDEEGSNGSSDSLRKRRKADS